jgi:hypothetical protein
MAQGEGRRMTRREALRQEALSDNTVFRHLTGQADTPVCPPLPSLQMAAEKLAKSLLDLCRWLSPARIGEAEALVFRKMRGRVA